MIKYCTFWWVTTLWLRAWDAQPVVCDDVVGKIPTKNLWGAEQEEFSTKWNSGAVLLDAWTSPSHICARSRKILVEEAAKPGLQWRFLLMPKLQVQLETRYETWWKSPGNSKPSMSNTRVVQLEVFTWEVYHIIFSSGWMVEWLGINGHLFRRMSQTSPLWKKKEKGSPVQWS